MSGPDPVPTAPALDETRAYMDELARRAQGEPPRAVRAAAPRATERRIRELRALTAGATDERPGAAGKATRVARRTTWLARDAHSRAHLETAAVLEELEARLAAAEDEIRALTARLAELEPPA
jgi:uncharacterized protein YceH (UPF0502 family)